MNQTILENLVLELIEENPFAVRTVLKLLRIEYTTTVPTLCVTMEERPRLLVNLDFVNKNCRSDQEVKALICHEFLHVLLRHTERKSALTPSEHLAMDAVINAIIHRDLGEKYSSMMGRYYAQAKGSLKLLRPMNPEESRTVISSSNLQAWESAWKGLYDGKLVVDDIKELADDHFSTLMDPSIAILAELLGNHAHDSIHIPEVLEEALERTLRSMNGSGIWRTPKNHGVGVATYDAIFMQEEIAMENWKRTALSVLRRYLTQNSMGKMRTSRERIFHVPVLNSRDRRAFIRSLWSPFLPDAEWTAQQNHPKKQTQVYLDVSGSMNAEMPVLISLLNQLRRYIRMPFWAFSTVVTPAVIEGGQLQTGTSGGTSLTCVLEHIAQTKPDAAVIVTDGYIEPIERGDLKKIRSTRIHVLVSRDGNADLIAKAGIDYTQLERIPK